MKEIQLSLRQQKCIYIFSEKKIKRHSFQKIYFISSDDFGITNYDTSKPDIVSGEFVVPFIKIMNETGQI